MRDVLGIAFDAASWEEAVACAQGDASASDTAHTTGAGFLARLLIAAVPICVLAHSDAVSDAVHEWRAAHHVASGAVACTRYTDATPAPEALDAHVRSLLRLEPADIAVVLSATSADAFTAAGFLCVVLGTPLNSLLPAGPPLQQVTVSDVPLLLARRLRAVVAGYTLTAKRERSLLASTLLPPLPRHGLCAAPVALPAHGDPPQLLAHALRRCDVIMHKATDQLAMPVGHALDIAPDVLALLACAASEGVPVLDPPALLANVLDRTAMAAVLARMPPCLGGAPTRAPTTTELQSLDPGHVAAALEAAGITLPCLLKPRVACGTPTAHNFALLAFADDAAAARVDVPAVAQAFVCHDGIVHKVYSFGDQVLTQQRRSLPAVDGPSCPAGVVSFDALHALPTSWCSGAVSDIAAAAPPLSLAAVHAMASWLRCETGLSLFGFDVLVETGTGAHVVVDLNYFPSATGVDGAPAALARAVHAALGRPS